MLEDIMKMELRKITETPNPDREVTQDVSEAKEKSDVFYSQLVCIDENLAEEFDSIDGLIKAAYSGMFFELGFKKAIALCNELKEVR